MTRTRTTPENASGAGWLPGLQGHRNLFPKGAGREGESPAESFFSGRAAAPGRTHWYLHKTACVCSVLSPGGAVVHSQG